MWTNISWGPFSADMAQTCLCPIIIFLTGMSIQPITGLCLERKKWHRSVSVISLYKESGSIWRGLHCGSHKPELVVWAEAAKLRRKEELKWDCGIDEGLCFLQVFVFFKWKLYEREHEPSRSLHYKESHFDCESKELEALCARGTWALRTVAMWLCKPCLRVATRYVGHSMEHGSIRYIRQKLMAQRVFNIPAYSHTGAPDSNSLCLSYALRSLHFSGLEHWGI